MKIFSQLPNSAGSTEQCFHFQNFNFTVKKTDETLYYSKAKECLKQYFPNCMPENIVAQEFNPENRFLGQIHLGNSG